MSQMEDGVQSAGVLGRPTAASLWKMRKFLLLVVLKHKQKRDKQLNAPKILQHCLGRVY